MFLYYISIIISVAIQLKYITQYIMLMLKFKDYSFLSATYINAQL